MAKELPKRGEGFESFCIQSSGGDGNEMMRISFVQGQHLTLPAQEGLRAAGLEVVTESEPSGPLVACWGWRNGLALKKPDRHVLVFERGYLGNRFEWTSVAWDGLNGYGDFCVPEGVDFDRFNSNFELKPWKLDGENIVIMGQIMGDMSLAGRDLTNFYEAVAEKLHCKYGKPVFFRPHPQANESRRNFSPDLPLSEGTLDEVLANAFLVVTWNSNSGVDSVISGIPTLSFDKGSMAYEVTGHQDCDRITPERQDWAAKLAYCQWSPEEIKNGVFWEQLCRKLEN